QPLSAGGLRPRRAEAGGIAGRHVELAREAGLAAAHPRGAEAAHLAVLSHLAGLAGRAAGVVLDRAHLVVAAARGPHEEAEPGERSEKVRNPRPRCRCHSARITGWS